MIFFLGCEVCLIVIIFSTGIVLIFQPFLSNKVFEKVILLNDCLFLKTEG